MLVEEEQLNSKAKEQYLKHTMQDRNGNERMRRRIIAKCKSESNLSTRRRRARVKCKVHFLME